MTPAQLYIASIATNKLDLDDPNTLLRIHALYTYGYSVLPAPPDATQLVWINGDPTNSETLIEHGHDQTTCLAERESAAYVRSIIPNCMKPEDFIHTILAMCGKSIPRMRRTFLPSNNLVTDISSSADIASFLRLTAPVLQDIALAYASAPTDADARILALRWSDLLWSEHPGLTSYGPTDPINPWKIAPSVGLGFATAIFDGSTAEDFLNFMYGTQLTVLTRANMT